MVTHAGTSCCDMTGDVVVVVVVTVLWNDRDELLHCTVWSVSCTWMSLSDDLVTCSWLPPRAS